MDQPRLALTFEDVLLVPRRSSIRSRRHVSTRARFTRGVELAIPIVSANMDTVTTAPMAIAMAELGGLGVLHRFLPTDAQAEEVRRVKRHLSWVVDQPYTVGPAWSWSTPSGGRSASSPPATCALTRATRWPRP
jgi:IMP dehydrogenase